MAQQQRPARSVGARGGHEGPVGVQPGPHPTSESALYATRTQRWRPTPGPWTPTLPMDAKSAPTGSLENREERGFPQRPQPASSSPSITRKRSDAGLERTDGCREYVTFRRPLTSRPSTTLTGRGGPPDSGMARAGPEPVGVGVTGGDGPAGLAPRGAHRVGSTTRARGLGEGAGGPPGAGGDRAARGRPTATPTFGPGARRVPRRAPVQDEPPGGLVRLLNTWPHDRHDSRRRSSLRSAVIARDRGC